MGTILVLDNVPEAARLVKRVLESAGHRVVAFTEHAAALDFLASQEADLAIVDLRLGRADGLEALSAIRDLQPTLRVMILTGSPTLETARQAKALGAAAYCTKPIDNEVLMAEVAALL